jgi:hypothetical protein
VGKKGGDDGGAAAARADEAARQARIRAGTKSIDDLFGQQFNDDFYNKRKTDYLNYATPQLDQQFGDAQKQLTFDLARSGTLNSSIRADKSADLQRNYDTNARQIGDQALSMSNDSRNSVEDARAGLISSLNVSGDNQQAVNSALTRSQALSQPQAYSALGPMFANFTSGLSTQAALERANALSGGLVKPTYNTGLFANSGAVKVSN